MENINASKELNKAFISIFVLTLNHLAESELNQVRFKNTLIDFIPCLYYNKPFDSISNSPETLINNFKF